MTTRRVAARGKVEGVVQGVGFRPFVYNLALKLGLSGRVSNTSAGVDLHVQGPRDAVDEFFRRLEKEPPPLAKISEIRRDDAAPEEGLAGYEIVQSTGGAKSTLISPDVATCQACLDEMRDPSDRRHGYPFINCTHCGPRYSIIRDLPYDRPYTTMAGFKLCAACKAEYEDPTDRRFHAQPVACPKCGPRVWLAGADGAEIECDDPIARLAVELRRGRVTAIKGLGGFHLAADAFNDEAVATLRRRKQRDAKPLALMVPDLAAAQNLADLDEADIEALARRERPIVLAMAKESTGLAPSIAPNNRLLGLMLPYTPLHHLLMDQGFAALVMTSGNKSDEPICLENHEALARLGDIADLFLLHDRPIHLRCDDSVVRCLSGEMRSMRRSRGFAPTPVLIPQKDKADPPVVLACGAHLKNTLCLLRGGQGFISQHVGDLDDPITLDYFEQTGKHLQKVLEAEPKLIACDLHPDYLSSTWAEAQARALNVPLVKVQHHHAHAVSVMAEHGVQGPALALMADGVGLGDDGTIWGCELMLADYHGYKRLGCLLPFALPGGDKASRQGWRAGASLLYKATGEMPDLPAWVDVHEHLPMISQMLDKGINSPLCSSLGRLFDGAAALAGLRLESAYEGQAAIELEQAIADDDCGAYSFDLAQHDGLICLDWRKAVKELYADAQKGRPVPEISAAFHQGLMEGIFRWVMAAMAETGQDRLCLGGGCFANAVLLCTLPGALEALGLKVHTPAEVPAGDGGLSLGQAVAARAAWQKGLIKGPVTVLKDL